MSFRKLKVLVRSTFTIKTRLLKLIGCSKKEVNNIPDLAFYNLSDLQLVGFGHDS